MNERESYNLDELKGIFTPAPCGVGVFAMGTREPLFLNDAYYRIVGYTPEEYSDIIANDDKKLVYPPDYPVGELIMKKYAENVNLSCVEYRIVQKNGGVCWVDLTMTPIDVDGVEYALCFFQDITAEKENFTQMKLVADSLGSSICVMRIKKGVEHLLYANETFFSLIGIDRDTYMGNTGAFNYTFTSGEDRDRTLNALRKSITTGVPQTVSFRFIRPGNKTMWMERRLCAVRQEEEDTYLMVSIATDITEKKNAELAVALEHRRYQMVIDEMNAVVFEWDLQSGMFYASENYKEYAMSAISPELLINNLGPVGVIHPDDTPILEKFFADTKSGAPRAEAILRMKLSKGGYRWCRMVGLFFSDEEGRATRTLGIIIDIGEEKESGFMLDSLLNELPGGVAVFKMGDIPECQYYNDGFAKLSNRTRDELDSAMRQRDFLETTIAPPDLQRFNNTIQRSVSTGEKINISCRFLTKEGELRWLHLNASRLREEDGCPVYYCVFTTPSEETSLYRSIVEDSTNGVLVAERKTRRIVYCNDMMRRLYRVGPDAPVVGRLVYDIIPWSTALLSDDELNVLTTDHFAEYHRQHEDCYLGIRARAVAWNGADCYILYATDESQEHQKRVHQEELLNLVPMGIGIFEIDNGELKQVYMNDSYYRMIGEPREKRQRREQNSFLSYVHEEDRDEIRNSVRRCIEGCNEFAIDYRILCGDGKYRWFRLAASVVRREVEWVTLYCGYANIDDTITARKTLEKANLEIQKQYEQELSQRKMLERDSMMAVQFNVTKDCLVSYRVNQGLFNEFPAGAVGDLIRPDISDNIPTEEERRIAEDFFSVTGAIERFRKGIKEYSAEYRRRLNDGRLYWLHSTCRLAKDEESGDLISYTYLRNIDTEKKKELTAESVIDEETDFVMLLNTVSDTAMLLRLRDNSSNTDWRLYTEFPFIQVLSVWELDVVEPDDRKAVISFFCKDTLLDRLKKEPVAMVTYKHHHPDGVVRWKKTRAFYLDETHEDIVIARRDITDIYEGEQAQQKALREALDDAKSASRAKSDFLSRMSHDLRTPMNVIMGLTSMAMDKDNIPEDMEEMLHNITSSAKYLLSLINDCLDLEKITSGKIELHPAPYPYVDFCESIMAVIDPLCKQKDITFEIVDGGKEYPAIIADRMRLEQIFFNLLSNAVKFTPKGGKIELLVQDRGNKDGITRFVFVVRDNGIGMSEDFQRHMFETFTQESNGITPEYQGSGLGLAIVKQLTELMDAEMEVKSVLGEGTEFTLSFHFPIVQGESQAEKEIVPFDLGVLRGKSVLLAEDHPLNAMIAVKLLEKKGISVLAVENGQQALDRFRDSEKGRFDAILMDIRMPLMNGLEAARLIRSLDRPDAKTIPIVAMTANAFDADVEESIRAGMNAHLSKPIEKDKLYETLSRLIG